MACKSGGINLETQIRHLHLLGQPPRPLRGNKSYIFTSSSSVSKYTLRSLSPGIRQDQNDIYHNRAKTKNEKIRKSKAKRKISVTADWEIVYLSGSPQINWLKIDALGALCDGGEEGHLFTKYTSSLFLFLDSKIITTAESGRRGKIEQVWV